MGCIKSSSSGSSGTLQFLREGKGQEITTEGAEHPLLLPVRAGRCPWAVSLPELGVRVEGAVPLLWQVLDSVRELPPLEARVALHPRLVRLFPGQKHPNKSAFAHQRELSGQVKH